MENDERFVREVVREIVGLPDKVEVTRQVDEMGVLISVKVAPEDMGLLIGRAGSTAKAIRTLARIVGMKNKSRVNLRIMEPEGSARFNPEKAKSVDDVVDSLT